MSGQATVDVLLAIVHSHKVLRELSTRLQRDERVTRTRAYMLPDGARQTPTNSGWLTLDFYVDCELRVGRALTWWLCATFDAQRGAWEITASVNTDLTGYGQTAVLTLPVRVAHTEPELSERLVQAAEALAVTVEGMDLLAVSGA